MTVKIYKPAKNAMQSGKANLKKWVLEHEVENTRYIDPIMGWSGNTDTKRQVRLKFDTAEEAVEYAKRKGFDYYVVEPNAPTVKIQSYAGTLM